MSEHVSDRELLLWMDGECDASAEAAIERHLAGCEECRDRRDALAAASAEFEAEYRHMPVPVPPIMPNPHQSQRWWKAAAAAVLLGVAWRAGILERSADTMAQAPLPALTPGATREISRAAMCSEGPGLRRVASEVADQVFRRYGIPSPPPPRTYEIDYLIPPDLGGSEDPQNLWPQPYARGVWNARVKDALEDRLRSLVCDGKLDLATAQRELSRDWIGAYKRYFKTEKPLLDHVAFYKDRPWE